MDGPPARLSSVRCGVVTVAEVEQYLALGHETRSFEVKGPGSLGDKAFCAKVARAVMAMGNLRDGGLVCLGIDEPRMAPMMPGLAAPQLQEWSDFDDVSDALARYSDPPVTFELHPLVLSSGVSIVVIELAEFETAPHICKRDYPEVLRRGTVYVRPRGKPESVPVPTHGDMRELLDLAITKGVREFIRRAGAAGIALPEVDTPQIADSAAFQAESDAAWSGSSPVRERILGAGFTDVSIRPGPYDRDRISPARLQSVIGEHAVRLRGWPVPYVDHRIPILRYGTWIGQDINPQAVPHCEAWRLCTSGQFLHRRMLTTDLVFSSELSPHTAGATGSVAVWDVLLYLVEVTELAARLATALGSETITIAAALNGVAGRELISGDWTRELHGNYLIQADQLQVQRVLDSTAVIADSRRVGVNVAQALLRQFGLDVPDVVLLDWQAQQLK